MNDLIYTVVLKNGNDLSYFKLDHAEKRQRELKNKGVKSTVSITKIGATK